MSIKFETINGQLCRMVEPTPLTPEANFPCVVRLIQDDSPMGLCNRWKYSEKQDFLKKDWTISSLENNLNKVKDIHYSQFEIIGYPVVEGSKDWALYQMMQGKKVRYKSAIGNVCWALNQDGDVQYYDMSNLEYIGTIRSKLEFCERKWDNAIWQLYEEPEPQYKVGDWVEYKIGMRLYQGQISEIDGALIVIDPTHDWNGEQQQGLYSANITRKISPSEVEVDFGSGIKGRVCMPYAEWGFGVLNDHNDWIAQIDPDALDAPTRELVESLLKAQEDKK